MKKIITLAMVSLLCASVSAQEYRVVGRHGNKVDISKDDVFYRPQPQQQPMFIDNDVTFVDGYDDVIIDEQVVENKLVKHQKTVNYYHVNEVKENHYYIDNTPRYVPRARRTYSTQRVVTTPRVVNSGYRQVEPIYDDGYYSLNAQQDNKWFFFFQFNSSYLTNREELGHLIDYAKSNPYSSLYIDSYADAETGTEEQNMTISKRRADTIINFLLNEGVDRSRLFVKNHGCVNQVYNTNNLNRCVTVKVVNK